VPVQKSSFPGVAPRRVQLVGKARSLLEDSFDRLAAKALQRFRESTPRTFHSLWVAIEAARADVYAAGLVGEAQSRRLQEALIRDLARLATMIARGPVVARERLARAAAEERGALGSLLEILDLSGDAIYRISDDATNAVQRRAGDVTCAGTLACAQCGRVEKLPGSRVVLPCRECGSRSLIKS